MPGIAGYIDFRNDVDKDLLPLMISAITHDESYIVEKYEDPPLWIGRSDLPLFNPEPQPLLEDGLIVFFEGNLTNKEELGEFGSVEKRSNADITAQLFHRYDIGFVNKVKGHFITFIWDSRQKRLLIVNDRFGIYPLYYAKIEGDHFLFASELKALLHCRMIEKEINDQAILDFVKFHFLMGDETFFKSIFLLPYASILEYRRGVLKINQYWDIKFSPIRSGKSQAEYARELHRLIDQAVRRAIGTSHRKIGIMLSGGLDSRYIAAHIAKDQGEVHTFTFGESGFSDCKLAKRVSDKLGFEHHFIPLTSQFIAELSEKTIFLLEGMTPIYTGQNINAVPDLEREKIDLLLEASSGNTIFTTHPPGSLIQRTFFVFPLIKKFFARKLYNFLPKDELLVKVYEQLYEQLGPEEISLKHLFSKEYYNRIKNHLGKSLEKAVCKASKLHKIPCSLIDYVLFTERLIRWLVNARSSFRWKVETVDPFLDYDLIDFMCNIPFELKLRRFLVRKELEMYHPELSNIPIRGSLVDEILKTIAQRVRITKIFPRITYERNILNTYLRAEREFIQKLLLDGRTLARGIFNPETIKKVVHDHMSNKKDFGATIGAMVSLELWFRLFVDTASTSTQ